MLKNDSILIYPAPGAYCPEKVKLNNAPQYSFGLRTPLEKLNDTPGKIYSWSYRLDNVIIIWIFFVIAPGTYSPEKVNLSKSPRYSLTGKGHEEKPVDTPGTL